MKCDGDDVDGRAAQTIRKLLLVEGRGWQGLDVFYDELLKAFRD